MQHHSPHTYLQTEYNKIPLNKSTWGWTGAELMNIPDYQIISILAQVLTGNYLLLLLYSYLGCTTNQRVIPFVYLLHLLVQGHHIHILCFLGSSQLKKLME